jgi:hypothetical protein
MCDDKAYAIEISPILERAKMRLDPEGGPGSVFHVALELCRKAANGEQPDHFIELLNRIVSDSLPWDDQFLRELHRIKRGRSPRA